MPTCAALRTEPMPSTIVQKMIGEIIILIRATKPVPSGWSSTAKSGATNPTAMPSDDGGDHRQVEVVGAVLAGAARSMLVLLDGRGAACLEVCGPGVVVLTVFVHFVRGDRPWRRCGTWSMRVMARARGRTVARQLFVLQALVVPSSSWAARGLPAGRRAARQQGRRRAPDARVVARRSPPRPRGWSPATRDPRAPAAVRRAGPQRPAPTSSSS